MSDINNNILLGHGSGGVLMDQLIRDFYRKFRSGNNEIPLSDSFVFPFKDGNLAFTTDSFIVDPLFFPGGDIGSLAVCGTVNDLAVSGAKPMYLSCSFIIEEGFPISDLNRIVKSMAEVAKSAEIEIVTGDTKVAPRGKVDKIFVNTAGIGWVKNVNAHIASGQTIETGDLILLNGGLGEHAIAVLSARENIEMETLELSDVAPLHSLIELMLNEQGAVKFMRDATRGGLASVLTEVVNQRNFGIRINEDKIPCKRQVKGVCDLFGFDPLYLANEGKLVAIVNKDKGERILKLMKQHPLGKHAAIIGEITKDGAGQVILKTQFGGSRILTKLRGEQLPRIC